MDKSQQSQQSPSLIGNSVQVLVESYPEIFPEVRENLLNISRSQPHLRSNQSPCPQTNQQIFNTRKSHAITLRIQANAIEKIFPDLLIK